MTYPHVRDTFYPSHNFTLKSLTTDELTVKMLDCYYNYIIVTCYSFVEFYKITNILAYSAKKNYNNFVYVLYMNQTYHCDTCSYHTTKKYNYDKHVRSDKHNKNTSNIIVYKCYVCNYKTTIHSNFKKHSLTEKHKLIGDQYNGAVIVCVDDDNNDNKQMVIHTKADDKSQIIALQQQLLEEKDNMNKLLKSQLETKDKQINNKDKQIKTSMGLLKYLMKNHPDSPPLKTISELSFIKDETEDRERIPELLIEYYNTDRFVPYLAENIVRLYKKDNPKEQSLWTSDVSRDNFIVKNRINENESKWIRDIKGAMMIEHAIKPCLNLIIDELEWYFSEINAGNFYDNRINSTLISRLSIMKIKQAIRDKKIEDELRKKLSSEFCFPNNAITAS